MNDDNSEIKDYLEENSIKIKKLNEVISGKNAEITLIQEQRCNIERVVSDLRFEIGRLEKELEESSKFNQEECETPSNYKDKQPQSISIDTEIPWLGVSRLQGWMAEVAELLSQKLRSKGIQDFHISIGGAGSVLVEVKLLIDDENLWFLCKPDSGKSIDSSVQDFFEWLWKHEAFSSEICGFCALNFEDSTWDDAKEVVSVLIKDYEKS